MAARKSVEEDVRALAALRRAPLDAAAHALLSKALGSRSSALVAAAASVLTASANREHDAALAEAFERFMSKPTETDKGCLAKTAIARALFASEADRDALFLRAIRHVQLEPVYGGKQDTASELRGVAAAALVQSDHPEVMLELARLLADPEPMARVAAAQALGTTRHVDAAVPLLRFKVLSGDPDARVLAACLSSLLTTAPERSLPVVVELLEAKDEALREVAAISLGESRLPGAFAPLRDAAERAALPEERRALLLGLALLRSEASHAYLLERITEEAEPIARLAIEALAVFRHDEELSAQVLQRAARSGTLSALAQKLFQG
jgi:HEAT repeat protein